MIFLAVGVTFVYKRVHSRPISLLDIKFFTLSYNKILFRDDFIESKKQSIESSPDNILLYDNLNNFIPNNEIGLGCTLLNSNVTSTDQNHSHG
jgi:hypothetical protein